MARESKVEPGSSSKDPDLSKMPIGLIPYYDAIVALTDPVCLEHLDEEYALLSRRLAAALCRKRPTPVTSGRISTWACGIVYAIGWVNFLFDTSSDVTMSAKDLCALFGVAQSTGSAKSSEIRRLVRMRELDPKWYRPSRLEEIPTPWMINVGGIIADIRLLPRDIQEEAVRLKLIPFLPTAIE